MKVSNVIREVSLDLNDQEPGYEYTHWTYEQLKTYLAEALLMVSERFSDKFVQHKVVKLSPGEVWQKACDCERIERVLGEVTEDGEHIIRRLSRVEDDETNTWSGPASQCHMGGDLTGYSISSTVDTLFRVYPGVSRTDRKEHYVLVECYVEPDGYDDDTNIPATLVSIVKQWMLYRALSMDSENNPAITQLAASHRDTYFKLVEAEMARKLLEENADGRVRAVSNNAAK